MRTSSGTPQAYRTPMPDTAHHTFGKYGAVGVRELHGCGVFAPPMGDGAEGFRGPSMQYQHGARDYNAHDPPMGSRQGFQGVFHGAFRMGSEGTPHASGHQSSSGYIHTGYMGDQVVYQEELPRRGTYYAFGGGGAKSFAKPWAQCSSFQDGRGSSNNAFNLRWGADRVLQDASHVGFGGAPVSSGRFSATSCFLSGDQFGERASEGHFRFMANFRDTSRSTDVATWLGGRAEGGRQGFSGSVDVSRPGRQATMGGVPGVLPPEPTKIPYPKFATPGTGVHGHGPMNANTTFDEDVSSGDNLDVLVMAGTVGGGEKDIPTKPKRLRKSKKFRERMRRRLLRREAMREEL